MRTNRVVVTLLILALPPSFIGMTTAAVAQTLTVPTQSINADKIAQTFKSNPAGGKGLVSGVATLALQSPENVKPICLMARQSPLPQQYAAAAGLRRAYDLASSNGNSLLATTIQTEVAECGDASATAFAGGEGDTDMASAGARVAPPSAPLTTAIPVSPAKP